MWLGHVTVSLEWFYSRSKFRKQFSTAASANLPFQDTSRARQIKSKYRRTQFLFGVLFFSYIFFTANPFFSRSFFPPGLPFLRLAKVYIIFFYRVEYNFCCREILRQRLVSRTICPPGPVPFTRKIPGIRSKTHKRPKFRRWSLSFNCFSQLAVDGETLKRIRKK